MFKVGDLVKIISTGSLYIYNINWFIKNGNIDLASRYAFRNSSPDIEKIYQIVEKSNSLYAIQEYNNTLNQLDECGYVFLIDECGLKLVEKPIEVGDRVKIIETLELYTTPIDWLNRHPNSATYFSYGNRKPDTSIPYIVKSKEFYNYENVYEIKSVATGYNPIFLIGEKGIKPVD